MNKWLVQTCFRKESAIKQEIEALNYLGYFWQDFGLLNHSKTITNLENILTDPNDSYIIRCGSKMLTLLDDVKHLDELTQNASNEQKQDSNHYLKKLKSGLFYNISNFDQEAYSQLDLPLINQHAKYYSLSNQENLNMTFSHPVFVKPSRDLKAFNAGILMPGQSVIEFIKSQPYQEIYQQERLLVSPVKKIKDEYRFFVLGHEVITGSQYVSNAMPQPLVLNCSKEHLKVLDMAKEYAKLYTPAEIFTMDIGKDDNDNYVIIEYNAFNASGLYCADVRKLFTVLHEFMQNSFNI